MSISHEHNPCHDRRQQIGAAAHEHAGADRLAAHDREQSQLVSPIWSQV